MKTKEKYGTSYVIIIIYFLILISRLFSCALYRYKHAVGYLRVSRGGAPKAMGHTPHGWKIYRPTGPQVVRGLRRHQGTDPIHCS